MAAVCGASSCCQHLTAVTESSALCGLWQWPHQKNKTKREREGERREQVKKRRARQLDEKGKGDEKGDRDGDGDGEEMIWHEIVWEPSPWEFAFCLVPISFHFAFSHVHSQIKLQTAQMCVKIHTHTREFSRAEGSEREGKRESSGR